MAPKELKIGDEGDLHLGTKQGEVRLRKPQIYQLSQVGSREADRWELRA